MNRDRLDALYRAAEYRVDHPGQPFVLRVDRPCPEPATRQACAGAGGAAFLTACNPRGVELSDDENRERNRRLAAQLDELAARVLPGVGRSPDGRWEEPSFLAIGIGFDQAMALAREHAQNAFLWIGDDGVARLAWTGTEAGGTAAVPGA